MLQYCISFPPFSLKKNANYAKVSSESFTVKSVTESARDLLSLTALMRLYILRIVKPPYLQYLSELFDAEGRLVEKKL